VFEVKVKVEVEVKVEVKVEVEVEVKVEVKVKVEPCEMSVAYFTGEVPPVLPRYSPLSTRY